MVQGNLGSSFESPGLPRRITDTSYRCKRQPGAAGRQERPSCNCLQVWSHDCHVTTVRVVRSCSRIHPFLPSKWPGRTHGPRWGNEHIRMDLSLRNESRQVTWESRWKFISLQQPWVLLMALRQGIREERKMVVDLLTYVERVVQTKMVPEAEETKGWVGWVNARKTEYFEQAGPQRQSGREAERTNTGSFLTPLNAANQDKALQWTSSIK